MCMFHSLYTHILHICPYLHSHTQLGNLTTNEPTYMIRYTPADGFLRIRGLGINQRIRVESDSACFGARGRGRAASGLNAPASPSARWLTVVPESISSAALGITWGPRFFKLDTGISKLREVDLAPFPLTDLLVLLYVLPLLTPLCPCCEHKNKKRANKSVVAFLHGERG